MKFVFKQFLFLWRCFVIGKNDDLLINGGILKFAKEVRLIGEKGEQLGVFQTSKAIEMAMAQNMDLVQMAGKAVPPVCKIMDYGKYKFDLSKKNKESKKKSKMAELKEIRLSVNIDTHDMETKAGHAKKFLESGSKIKVSLKFKGRQMAHPDIGRQMMLKFAEFCKEFAVVEKTPSIDNKNMFMFLAPIKSVTKPIVAPKE